MPSIYRRGNVSWIRNTVSGRQVRRSLRTGNAGKAKEELEKRERELTWGMVEVAVEHRIRDQLEPFLSYQALRNRTEKYVKLQRSQLRKFLDSLPVSRAVDVSPGHVLDFLARLGVSGQTGNRYRATISKFFRWMSTQGFVAHNPVARVEAAQVDVPPVDFLTVPQRDKLVAAARGTDMELPVLLTSQIFAGREGFTRPQVVSLWLLETR